MRERGGGSGWRRAGAGLALLSAVAGALLVARLADDATAPRPRPLEGPAWTPGEAALATEPEGALASAPGAEPARREASASGQAEDPAAPGRPLALELDPAASAAPLEGSVRDASGLALAGCVLAIERVADSTFAPAEDRSVRTTAVADESGGFRTGPIAAGLYGVTAFLPECGSPPKSSSWTGAVARGPDDLREIGRELVEHRPRGRNPGPPVQVQVELGPRYRVELRLPRGVRSCELDARLLSLGGPEPRLLGWRAGLEDGDPLLLRFPRPIDPRAAYPLLLVLASDDEAWVGSARVACASGACAEPVAVVLTHRARCLGRVLDATGEPVAGVALRYAPAAASGEPDHDPTATSDPGGRFALRGLPPGDGTLVLSDAAGEQLRERVELRAGEATPVELRLDGPRSGPVSGRLVLRSGSLEHPPRLELVPLDGGLTYARGATFARDEDGRLEFVFERVPHGEYELVVSSVDGLRWRPERLRVRVPRRDIEIVRLDEPVRMLVLDVLGAEEGAPIDAPFGLYVLGDRTTAPRCAPGTVVVDGIEAGGALYVGAPGHRVARADLGACTANGRFLAGTLRLEEGYGQIVRATDAATGRPLEGVVVRADGRALARTDAAGVAVLTADAPPAELELDLPGWTLAWSDGPTLRVSPGALSELSMKRRD